MVIDFPGNRFNGGIAPAIADLVDRGVVWILDLVFVKKGSDGSITSFEYDELKKLAELRDAGILTEDEFAGRKSMLLGG